MKTHFKALGSSLPLSHTAATMKNTTATTMKADYPKKMIDSNEGCSETLKGWWQQWSLLS